MKKAISLFLSLVMLLSVIAGIDFSAMAKIKGDYKYDFVGCGDEYEYAVIVKYYGKGKNIKIPSEFDGYKVKEIYGEAFRNCESLISVTIPNNIEKIGSGAFLDCVNMKKVTLPNSLVEIGEYAFFGCQNLSEISIPKNVKRIGYVAFEDTAIFNNKNNWEDNVLYIGNALVTVNGDFSIENYKIKNNISVIADDAFQCCNNLKSITLTNGVKAIGDKAFYSCDNLRSIILPKSIKEIGFESFCDCAFLRDVYYYGSKKDWDDIYIDGSNGDLTSAKIHYNYNSKVITLSKTNYTCDGKVKTPSVTIKVNGRTLKKNTDYTVTYAKGRKNVGKYTVTIKFKGNYSGTVTKSFTIVPKSTTPSKVTAGKKKFTVKWKKQTKQVTGYQIQYATNSKFTKNKKTITINKNKTTSKTVSKLKAKKKYYVRVRTYKTVKINGKSTKIYSAWSKAKTVTTKK